MTEQTTTKDAAQVNSEPTSSTLPLDQVGVARSSAKELPEAILVRGQRHVPPAGRHSQQSHRRAQARAAAEGHATIQEQHAHDRTTVKAEADRIAARKAARKTKSLG
jgi:hypothetical protein